VFLSCTEPGSAPETHRTSPPGLGDDLQVHPVLLVLAGVEGPVRGDPVDGNQGPVQDDEGGYARGSYDSGGGAHVTGAADRTRRDRRLCPCQLRAGEQCAVRGEAPLVICSGAASRRGLPYGGSTRFYGVQLGGKVIGAGFGGCGCGAGTGEQQREAVTVLP
jgi:hypothetical protein